jgi:hypothetical protein
MHRENKDTSTQSGFATCKCGTIATYRPAEYYVRHRATEHCNHDIGTRKGIDSLSKAGPTAVELDDIMLTEDVLECCQHFVLVE